LDGLKRLFEAAAGAGDQPAAQDAKSAAKALPSEVAGVSAAVDPEIQDAPKPDPLGLKVARAVQEAVQAAKAESSGPAGLTVAQAVHEVLRANQGATDGQGRPGRSEALSAKAQAKSQTITSEAPEGQAQASAPSAEPDRPFLSRERFQAAVQAAQGQAGGGSAEPTGQRTEREISPETLEPRLAAAQADQLAGGPVAVEKSEASPELVRQVAHQVARAVRGGLNRGEERLRLRLSPPELGEVRLDLKLHGADLKVILVAETQTAREALQASIPELRRSLAEQGLRLEEFRVFVRQDGAEGFAFLGREQAGRQQAEAQAEPGPQVQGGAEPEAGATHTLGPAGRINLFC
jgi:flagellar hook-length control protein FliK